ASTIPENAWYDDQMSRLILSRHQTTSSDINNRITYIQYGPSGAISDPYLSTLLLLPGTALPHRLGKDIVRATRAIPATQRNGTTTLPATVISHPGTNYGEDIVPVSNIIRNHRRLSMEYCTGT
ncbi:hypothetical protein CHS0354_022008, partial [Potamilus streckersoni]